MLATEKELANGAFPLFHSYGSLYFFHIHIPSPTHQTLLSLGFPKTHNTEGQRQNLAISTVLH